MLPPVDGLADYFGYKPIDGVKLTFVRNVVKIFLKNAWAAYQVQTAVKIAQKNLDDTYTNAEKNVDLNDIT